MLTYVSVTAPVCGVSWEKWWAMFHVLLIDWCPQLQAWSMSDCQLAPSMSQHYKPIHHKYLLPRPPLHVPTHKVHVAGLWFQKENLQILFSGECNQYPLTISTQQGFLLHDIYNSCFIVRIINNFAAASTLVASYKMDKLWSCEQ